MAVRADDERLSVREAAQECGKNAETIRRWIWSGKLPAEKLGNQLFIRKRDLVAFCGREPEVKKKSDWLERAKALQNRIREKTKTEFDTALLVRESRERLYHEK